jgi:hypothetical protein
MAYIHNSDSYINMPSSRACRPCETDTDRKEISHTVNGCRNCPEMLLLVRPSGANVKTINRHVILVE